MDARDKLKKAKTLGKTTVNKGGKTKTTTNKGWSITSGVQKKTVAPKHKASPASTAGRSIKYHGGKSNVIDLGHNPTKSAVSTATTKLRKAKTTTKPKATKHSAASVPTIKVPQVGAPTVPSRTPDTKPNASSNTAGKVVAAGVAVAGATGIAAVAAVALKKAKAPVPKAKPPRPGGDPKQLRLPGAPKGLPGRTTINLPEPLKGLPGPEKMTKRQVLDQARQRSAALIPEAAPKITGTGKPAGSTKPTEVKMSTPTVAQQHATRRARQGAALKNAFGAAARADARASTATVEAGGKVLDAASVVEQRPKQIVSSTMDAEGKRTTKVIRGENMENVLAEADKRVGEERRQTDRGERGQRRAPGVAAVTPPKAPSAAGFGASEADIEKVATSGEKVKAPSTTQAAANKAKVAEAPKEVRDMVADIDKAAKVEAPKVGRFPTHPTMGGLAADQKGKVKAPLKGVVPRPAEIPTVKVGGADAQAVYKLARETMRPGAADHMKDAVDKPGGVLSGSEDVKNLERDLKRARATNEKLKAKGNKPPTTTPAPKVEVPEAPKAPKPVKHTADQPKVGRLAGVPAEPKVDPKLAKELEKARAKNEKLKAAQPADQALVNAELKKAQAQAPAKPAKVEAPAEPMRGVTEGETRAAAGDLRGVNVGSVEPAQAQGSKKTATDKDFYRKRGAARRAANKQSIEAKGLATIPTDPTEVTSEEALVKQKVAERNLMEAVARAEGAGPKPAPKAVGAEGDKRTSTDLFGKEAVAEKTRVIDMVPPDLETEHGGGRQRSTIGDLIGKDQDARNARGEEVRKAAAKVRNIAASRNAGPEQMGNLERAVDAEYDKTLEKYFDEAEPRNQRGPRKADARPRLLDPMIDAEVELANERGSAMPPAPADRTTLDQKIAIVEERAKAGGAAVYQPEKTLEMLRNIREHGRATPAPLMRTTAMPPQADLVTEQFAKDRPSVQRARQEGINVGETAAKAKRVSGKQGPVDVPDMTKPGVIPAGPTTPPVEPARERGRVQGPPKTTAQLWAGRMADWGRAAYQAQVKRLTSPAIDVAGEKAKATGKAEARVRGGGVARGGIAAVLGFGLLGAGEAGARTLYGGGSKESAAKEAGKALVEGTPEVAEGLAKFTAADIAATKALPHVAQEATRAAGNALAARTAQTSAGRSIANALLRGAGKAIAKPMASVKGVTKLLGMGGMAAWLAPSNIEAAKTAAQFTQIPRQTRQAQEDAERNADVMNQRYGTVERATRTRKGLDPITGKKVSLDEAGARAEDLLTEINSRDDRAKKIRAASKRPRGV